VKYYGDHLTDDDCEILALTQIHAQHLEDEAAAMQTKWFDYRMMPHVRATYLFARHFNLAYQRFFAETRDKETSKMIRGIHHEDVFQSRDKTTIHLARQAFDLAGVRYEFGLSFAMRRFLERGWKTMPRPNQLYGDELIADMKEAWVIECDARLQVPKHAMYLAENYTGTRLQREFHEWLFKQINRRSSRHLSLGQAVYVEKVLPESVALEVYGEGLLGRGKRSAVL
jgi:hypothetical protein